MSATTSNINAKDNVIKQLKFLYNAEALFVIIAIIIAIALLVIYTIDTTGANSYYNANKERMNKPISIKFNMENTLKTTVIANDITSNPIMLASSESDKDIVKDITIETKDNAITVNGNA